MRAAPVLLLMALVCGAAPAAAKPRTVALSSGRRIAFEVERATRSVDARLTEGVRESFERLIVEKTCARPVELTLSYLCPGSPGCRATELQRAEAELFAQLVIWNDGTGVRIDVVWMTSTSTAISSVVGRAGPASEIGDQLEPLLMPRLAAAGLTDPVGSVRLRRLPAGARLRIDGRDELMLADDEDELIITDVPTDRSTLWVQVTADGETFMVEAPSAPAGGESELVVARAGGSPTRRGFFGGSMLLGAAGVAVLGAGLAIASTRPPTTCIDLGRGCPSTWPDTSLDWRRPVNGTTSAIPVGIALAGIGVVAGLEALIRGEPEVSPATFVLSLGLSVAATVVLSTVR